METLGGMVGTAGLVMLGVALWGLWKGRVGWAHLSSRGASGVVLGVGLVLMSVGGALIPNEERIASTGTSTPDAPTTTRSDHDGASDNHAASPDDDDHGEHYVAASPADDLTVNDAASSCTNYRAASRVPSLLRG